MFTEQDYIKEIGNYPLLTEAQEQELGRMIAEGNDIEEAQEKLVKHNLRLVVYWAKKYMGLGLDFEDLVQEGNLGLIRASKNYDYTKGKFSMYASYNIRAAILKALDKTGKLETVSLEKKIGNDEDIELGDFLADETVKSVEEEILETTTVRNHSSMYKNVKEMEVSDSVNQYIFMQLLEGTNHEVIRKNLGISEKEFEERMSELRRKATAAIESGNESVKQTTDFREMMTEENRLENLPTGETTHLTDEHDMYNMIFSDYDEVELDDEGECWEFEKNTFEGSKKEELFFETVRKIKNIPGYKCIVRYLMRQYGACMSEENLKELWNVLEAEEWGAKSKLKDADKEAVRYKVSGSNYEEVTFSKKDYEYFMNYLSLNLKEDYERCGIFIKGAWTTYFKKLIYELNAGRLDEMALALHMEVSNYLNFRKKVLKLREKDYLDSTFVFMFLTLKYAEVCGQENLKAAFENLTQLYKEASVLNAALLNKFDSSDIGKQVAKSLDDPTRKKSGKLAEEYKEQLFVKKVKALESILEQTADSKEFNTVIAAIVLKYAKQCSLTDKKRAYDFLQQIYRSEEKCGVRLDGNPDTSVSLGEKLLLNLEEKGKLQQEYKDKLFCEKISELTRWFEQIDLLKNLEIIRSGEAVFRSLWKQFYAVLEEYGKDKINEMTRRLKGTDGSGTTDYKLDDHKIFRFLYGENVEIPLPNRIKDIEDEEMTVLDEVCSDFFLDSKDFLATRINDNKIRNFPKGEKGERIQRNLLLTMIFLNFVQDPDNLAEDYDDRLSDFEFRVWETLSACGFMLLHSTSAYDSYLKLLLSCSEPIELFKYIWKRKTKSTI